MRAGQSTIRNLRKGLATGPYPIVGAVTMTFRRVILACALFAGVLRAQSSGDQDRVEYARRIIIGLKTVEPADGYVPDASAAIAIGTAVLAPIYGRSTIDAEQPWNAGLKDGVWTVVGTFNG